MNKFHKFLALFLILALPLTLVACAQEEAPPAEEVEEAGEVEEVEEVAEEVEVAEEEEASTAEVGPLNLYVMPVTRPYMPDAEGVAGAIAADLAAVGIQTEMVSLGDWALFLDERTSGNLTGLYFLGWTGDNGDPDNFLGYFFAAADEPLAREGFVHVPDIAAVLMQARAEPDPAVRGPLYIQAEQMLYDDVTRVWLAYNRPPILLTADITGYAASPIGTEFFRTVTVPEGTTFTFGAQGDAVSLDPATETDGESFRITEQGCEGLLEFAPGTAVPVASLATEWTYSDDTLTWAFTLREGVTFHDGTPFNADAVVFNFERWMYTDNPYHFEEQTFEYYETMWGENIASVTAVDEYTVEFVFVEPTTVLPNLAMPMFAFASPTAIETYGVDYGTPDVGYVCTGPYEFVEWITSDHTTMELYPDYWGEVTGNIETIVVRPIVDPAARLAALQAGEIDGYFGAGPEDVEAAEADENLQVLRRDPVNCGYLAFNYRVAELRDPLVREAVALAINREALVDAFFGGAGQVANQWLPPGMLGHDEDALPGHEYNPTRAMELLAEAGYPDGISEVTVYPVDEDGNIVMP